MPNSDGYENSMASTTRINLHYGGWGGEGEAEINRKILFGRELLPSSSSHREIYQTSFITSRSSLSQEKTIVRNRNKFYKNNFH